jgi:TonB family protein
MPNIPRPPIPRSFVILIIAGLSLAAADAAPARRKVPTGSHTPQILNPFRLPDAVYQSLFVGTTPGGRMLSFPELAPLVVYAKWPTNLITIRTSWRFKIGVFLLHVRPDGTVSDVETLHSIGHPTANADSVRAFKQWRFRPNSVKAVRVPTYYTRV